MLALVKSYADDIIYIFNNQGEDDKKALIKVANNHELRYNRSRKIKELGAIKSPQELIKEIKNYMYIDKETSVLWPDEWVAIKFTLEGTMELPRRIN